MAPFFTLLADDSDADYAQELEEIFLQQDITIIRFKPFEPTPLPERIGDPLELFGGSEYLIILLSDEMRRKIYSIPGYRPTLDAAVRRWPHKIFVILTDKAWIPGIPGRQVFIDLQARNALPIVFELLTTLGIPSKFERIAERKSPTDVVRRGTNKECIANYLSDLVALSEYAGIIAFSALLYRDDLTEVMNFINTPEGITRLDIKAGPHLDVFAIEDTMLTEATESDTDQSRIIGSSLFISELLGLSRVQVHYPSAMLFLIENQSIIRTAIAPVVYSDPSEFEAKFSLLTGTIAEAMRERRKRGGLNSDQIWHRLFASMNERHFPLTEYIPPSDPTEAIELIANSIKYY